ncbi:unnamed protein product [Nesidiocoris tenuis]|uniref:Uncharacterized protein n=1 Tax=Nesidiocoris tenuis TaxID=355587 RepID=A0A6H5FUA3_9HEMI|nr:unnamed protein product [Nesidiocoris tenuis]
MISNNWSNESAHNQSKFVTRCKMRDVWFVSLARPFGKGRREGRMDREQRETREKYSKNSEPTTSTSKLSFFKGFLRSRNVPGNVRVPAESVIVSSSLLIIAVRDDFADSVALDKRTRIKTRIIMLFMFVARALKVPKRSQVNFELQEMGKMAFAAWHDSYKTTTQPETQTQTRTELQTQAETGIETQTNYVGGAAAFSNFSLTQFKPATSGCDKSERAIARTDSGHTRTYSKYQYGAQYFRSECRPVPPARLCYAPTRSGRNVKRVPRQAQRYSQRKIARLQRMWQLFHPRMCRLSSR